MDCIKTLEGSPTFHMSLGSKELFHSNFLCWLSTVDWDVFLSIMHELAGIKTFWWENDFCPPNGNLEVRRESNNFDLSIYIFNENKWIPVLVLENKVKSIPYKEQLERYQEKAVSGWREGDKEKEGRYISFILLSLWKGINGVLPEQGVKKPIVKWNSVSYDCLSEVLNEKIKNLKDDLNKTIINDYKSFISSLSNLANDSWKLYESNAWSKVYPEKNNDDYIRYKKLRIHDLWEKINYEQLLAMLIKELKNTDNIKDIITLDEDTYNKKCGKVYCKAGYSHGIGAIEVHVKKVDDIEYIIQVQGNQYRRAVVSKEIVEPENYYKREFKDTDLNLDFSFKENGEPYSFKGRNGKTFRYSKSTINGETSISVIIKAMCDDILFIYQNIFTTK